MRLTTQVQPQPPAAGASLGIMMFKFHVSVKTGGAVAVACSDLIGILTRKLNMIVKIMAL
jgi:hypothetical protein